MKEFRAHTGEIVTGDRLTAACAKVADVWATNARAIRREDLYASHVTDADKDRYLEEGLAVSERVRAGEMTSFTIWQRVNTVLTGECVALLGSGK